jgi:hypothetical protein
MATLFGSFKEALKTNNMGQNSLTPLTSNLKSRAS